MNKRPPEYGTWNAIKQRCHNPNNPAYANYGGRGIKVCARWRRSFTAFLGDMGPRPADKTSIDRIDNSKGYSPDNCRWATQAEQMRNTRATVMIEYKGRSMILIDWCEELGLDYNTMAQRMKNPQFTVAAAFETSVTRKPRVNNKEKIVHEKYAWQDDDVFLSIKKVALDKDV